MNHEMTRVAKTTTLLLLAAMFITVTLAYPANARSLTNSAASSTTSVSAGTTTTSSTNCNGDVCQTVQCINNNCRTNSSKVLNPNVPCYLPCLPAASPSKPQ